jgi:hypothetical protein
MIQILLGKILHFVGGTGRMMRIHKLSENGWGARVTLCIHPTHIHLFITFIQTSWNKVQEGLTDGLDTVMEKRIPYSCWESNTRCPESNIRCQESNIRYPPQSQSLYRLSLPHIHHMVLYLKKSTGNGFPKTSPKVQGVPWSYEQIFSPGPILIFIMKPLRVAKHTNCWNIHSIKWHTLTENTIQMNFIQNILHCTNLQQTLLKCQILQII